MTFLKILQTYNPNFFHTKNSSSGYFKNTHIEPYRKIHAQKYCIYIKVYMNDTMRTVYKLEILTFYRQQGQL